MYLDYFGLRQKPFLITPDPAFLYPSAGHQRALAHLQYGLQREGGFLLLTGEVGTGKTTLCRLFMDSLPGHFRLAYLLNTKLDSGGLLAGICHELGIDVAGERDTNTLVARLHDNLLEAHAAGRHTLVVIEEAQNLAPEVLETLRLLTNLETATTKLLHILLIGQPELLDTLRQPGLRQLNQRVVSRSHLGPLARADLPPYLRHRLKMAGTERPLFSRGAIDLLHRRTGGIPRLVNLLAEHCLMGAYATGSPQVDRAIVRQAARELQSTLHQPARGGRRGWFALAAILLLGLALSLGIPFVRQDPQVQVAPSAASQASPPQAPVVEEPGEPAAAPASPPPGAHQRLLDHWGIDTPVASRGELCQVALQHQLKCVPLSVASPADLRDLASPLVVRLFNERDGLDILYLEVIDDDTGLLANSGGEGRLPLVEIVPRLDGEALYLWRTPPGYQGPLSPGQTNHQLVASVQEWLQASGHLEEVLVTGGVYSDYLADRVRAFQADAGLAVDGILGEQTLMHLSRHQRIVSLAPGGED